MKFSTCLSLALAPLAALADHHGGDSHDKNNNNNNNGGGNNIVNVINAQSTTEVIIIWANPGNGAATTTINQKVTVTETITATPGAGTAASAAAVATHTVTVGGPAGLVYTPDSLSGVPIGDMVVFEFLEMNHTVSQSGFDTPCELLAGGMDSGFMPNPNNTVVPPPQIAMQVMVDTPLWFYCRQEGHCGKGMVFSINPTADKTQADFQAMAIAQNGTSDATPVTGGSADASASSASAVASATDAASGATAGTGTINSDGSCTCIVACDAAGFPALGVQGVGAFGGVAGAVPMKMAAVQ